MAAEPDVTAIVQPRTGLISRVDQLQTAPGEPAFSIATARMGDIWQTMAGPRDGDASGGPLMSLDGAGGGLTPDVARIRAIGESLERYCSCVYDDKQFICATANELGADALALDGIPRCSEQELAHPRCPLVRPDKDAPIRWVRGVSLLDGRCLWVPAVMVYLQLPYRTDAERIALRISTGCAAHVTYEQALLSATCEVVERDAISLVWLQRLALPRIDLDCRLAELAPYLARERKTTIQHYFFDATSDLGIPTVYSVQVSPGARLATLVMCSTELDPAVAIAKVTRECASSRLALQRDHPIPGCWDDYTDVIHGALFMGAPEQAAAFDFLLRGSARRPLSHMPNLATGDPRRDLARVIEILRRARMEAVAVDLSADEAIRAGMRAVRVVIPALQPLSFSYRARYLGHPRLYEAPPRFGFPSHSESALNVYPQPFA
ncbi:MAG: YcaO-like family protein [Vicinamibacterales bacterium]